MPVLDDILSRQQQAQDTQLAQASHDNDWAQTFASTPPAEVLRASRNLTDLVSQALDRKAQLLAQTDEHAAKIYETNQKLKEWQQQAPLRDSLLRARINAEGASTRFQQAKQAQTLQDTAGFYNHMLNGPKPSEDGYDAHVVTGITKYPAFATTGEGRDLLKTLGQEHDMGKQLQNIQNKLPAEMQLNTVEAGPNKLIHSTYSRPDSEAAPKLPDSAISSYAKIQSDILGHEKAATAEREANIQANKPNTPYSDSADWDLAQKNAVLLLQKYPSLAAMNPARVTTDPRIALAQKALDDPNASEVHKAAARKILGK